MTSTSPARRRAGADPRGPIRMWSQQRLFRLGFLVGRGFKARDIARDPIVGAEEAEVRGLTRRLGGTFTPIPCGNLMIDLSGAGWRELAAQARRRRQGPEALATTALRILLADPTLFANVLDDEP